MNDEKLIKNIHLDSNIYEGDFDQLEHLPTRDGWGKALVELGKKNKDVVVLSADLSGSVRTDWFEKECPNQFFEVGIAEQNMANIAVGLAASGKIPFISTYAVFCPGRCWDQMRISSCYGKFNVKFGGAHAGISVGPDGATHQALEDIAITRCIPNLVVLSPCDFWEAKKATMAMADINGPVYIRFHREKLPIITTEDTPFVVGKGITCRDGNDVSFITTGAMTHEALKAAKELAKEGIDARVINIHTIKPIDKELIIDAAKETGAIVTAEEHQVMGGFGSAVAEVLVENCPVPMKMVGIYDSFGTSGTPEELMVKFGLTFKELYDAAKHVINKKGE